MIKKYLMFAISSLGMLALPLAHASIFTFTEDFSGYNQGFDADLAGQGGWENTGGVNSARPEQFAAGPVVIGRLGGSRDKLKLDYPAGFQLDSSHTIIFSMVASLSALAPASGSNFGFGVGRDPDAHFPPNHIGYWTGVTFRQANFQTLDLARDLGGNAISLVTGDWYEFRSVWDLDAGTANLAMRNIDQGEADFTQLYFDAAQTQSTVALGDLANISEWDTIWLRLGDGGNSRVLELNMEVIPEPSFYGFVFGGLVLGYVLWRRRQVNR